MITYQTEDIAMPPIKKRETTEWVKQVAGTYYNYVVLKIHCSNSFYLDAKIRKSFLPIVSC